MKVGIWKVLVRSQEIFFTIRVVKYWSRCLERVWDLHPDRPAVWFSLICAVSWTRMISKGPF